MSKKTTFEDNLYRISEISGILSSGDIELDEAVALYKEATELAVKCRKMLADAELKIARISKDFSGIEEEEN